MAAAFLAGAFFFAGAFLAALFFFAGVFSSSFAEADEEKVELHRLDPDAERRQIERTARVRAERDAGEAERTLAAVRAAAQGTENLLVPMKESLRALVTVGEISNVLREEWGTFDASQAAS